ncbi:hypothetical protein Tsubulata_046160 [Turnera subulata]|uniref:Uncharacterized protein n=1 Tax=Turnera subulata TaxID=218843 RepID=A0A9Q0JAV9_9ROSI|nr:hypothetical protein Tsubulata_046160 [Turnera subulata]
MGLCCSVNCCKKKPEIQRIVYQSNHPWRKEATAVTQGTTDIMDPKVASSPANIPGYTGNGGETSSGNPAAPQGIQIQSTVYPSNPPMENSSVHLETAVRKDDITNPMDPKLAPSLATTSGHTCSGDVSMATKQEKLKGIQIDDDCVQVDLNIAGSSIRSQNQGHPHPTIPNISHQSYCSQETYISNLCAFPKTTNEQTTRNLDPGPSSSYSNTTGLHQKVGEEEALIQPQTAQSNLQGATNPVQPTTRSIEIQMKPGMDLPAPKSGNTDMQTEPDKLCPRLQTNSCNSHNDDSGGKNSNVPMNMNLTRLKGIRIKDNDIQVDFLIVEDKVPGIREQYDQQQPHTGIPASSQREENNFERYNHGMVNDIREELGPIEFDHLASSWMKFT